MRDIFKALVIVRQLFSVYSLKQAKRLEKFIINLQSKKLKSWDGASPAV